MTQVLREMRVKGALMDHKEIRAAMGVKIVAPGLEHAVAGTSMYVVSTTRCFGAQPHRLRWWWLGEWGLRPVQWASVVFALHRVGRKSWRGSVVVNVCIWGD